MARMVIRGGTLIDGTGGEARLGDIAINDGKITAIGDVAAAEGDEVIDASGSYVCPGFVDPSHPLRRPADVGPGWPRRRTCTASPRSWPATAGSPSLPWRPATRGYTSAR
jgi:cytosine/adenosine deaminase-related metal-dependent hydrolase